MLTPDAPHHSSPPPAPSPRMTPACTAACRLRKNGRCPPKLPARTHTIVQAKSKATHHGGATNAQAAGQAGQNGFRFTAAARWLLAAQPNGQSGGGGARPPRWTAKREAAIRAAAADRKQTCWLDVVKWDETSKATKANGQAGLEPPSGGGENAGGENAKSEASRSIAGSSFIFFGRLRRLLGPHPMKAFVNASTPALCLCNHG